MEEIVSRLSHLVNPMRYGPKHIKSSVFGADRYRQQLTMVDPSELESDTFALAFYRTEFAL